ncbi:protein of unknown function [Prosthecobacter debontii]|uniref:Transcobalamin-like C-terminal domain-containing protein n=2 Tax=Prosthecobacter debontii TaxID=48467 RepID=A0A1T4YKQ1_9BACT|nr:protein of unknown function [Prosthecobacter debontii]
MNAQQALEGAYNQINNTSQFTFSLQYYGAQFGYLVMMINETYDSFISSAAPFFYWAFYLNGVTSQTGIDQTVLNAGDTITFAFETYSAETHQASTLGIKHSRQMDASQKSNA